MKSFNVTECSAKSDEVLQSPETQISAAVSLHLNLTIGQFYDLTIGGQQETERKWIYPYLSQRKWAKPNETRNEDFCCRIFALELDNWTIFISVH